MKRHRPEHSGIGGRSLPRRARRLASIFGPASARRSPESALLIDHGHVRSRRARGLTGRRRLRTVLCKADDLLAAGRGEEAARCLRALAEEQHASVLHEMLRVPAPA